MDVENTMVDPHLPVQPTNIPGTSSSSFTITKNPTFDAALTTLIGLGLVFIGGVGYWEWYKTNVLFKIEKAFAPGYDPALELARQSKHRHPEMGEEPTSDCLRRKEQDIIDRIIHGEGNGRYYVLIGCKGSGKGTMIIDAMEAISADGVAICEAHSDLEVFRLRLGKALNFEYNEDTQTSLFQRRDPREGGPALDIERALNKLEKVALKLSRQRGRPLIHLFRNEESGQALLLQLQQRAESWSESGKTSNRMQVLSLYDLSIDEAIHAFKRLRTKLGRKPVNEDTINQVLQYTGGRLAYINKTARSEDPLGAAKHILETEKGWLLSQIGLIPDCDDDVMDEQKWSSCSWLLMREFVKLHLEQLEERKKILEVDEAFEYGEVPLPSIPYWRCRQIMTRADFLEALDHANIISIDIHNHVRPDSMIILRAAMEVVQEEGFDELLDSVRGRVDEIESLHRTRELTFKDLGKGDCIRLSVDKTGPS
ncbi:hypothetical protein Clacol_002681 [Clathrus columnatus]|uniref:AAA protein C-terminal winged helix domain-containing protein n=1 Tax=Clathrus columnatus TaxID=1419009 RepID=A0AAV5A4R8_9AGAM|nr:hypothetical protein Clacol_002681 [Clathrus columnatus]